MTLNQAKTLLTEKGIPFEVAQYENEAAYWQHLMPFPRVKLARPGPVAALVIPAVNGVKHIELQFSRLRGEYVLEELWFGGYGFELFDTREENLPGELLELIFHIAEGKLAVITATDLKRKRAWMGDACYDLTDADTVLGAPGFREAVKEIEAPKTFWQKLTGMQVRYDIYDWRTYRQIVK